MSWRLPDASHSVQERTGCLQECPRASWSILKASRNVFQAFPGRSKVTKNAIFVDPNLLNDSENFVVSMKLFQSVLECFGSLQKRPRASQKCPGMSQSTLQRAPGTLQNVPKRPRASDLAFANGLQDIRDVSGKALQRTRMPECLHMARQSRASHSPMLPQVLVKITPITSIANGVILAILSLVILSATTIQTISRARGASAPSC